MPLSFNIKQFIYNFEYTIVGYQFGSEEFKEPSAYDSQKKVVMTFLVDMIDNADEKDDAEVEKFISQLEDQLSSKPDITKDDLIPVIKDNLPWLHSQGEQIKNALQDFRKNSNIKRVVDKFELNLDPRWSEGERNYAIIAIAKKLKSIHRASKIGSYLSSSLPFSELEDHDNEDVQALSAFIQGLKKTVILGYDHVVNDYWDKYMKEWEERFLSKKSTDKPSSVISDTVEEKKTVTYTATTPSAIPSAATSVPTVSATTSGTAKAPTSAPVKPPNLPHSTTRVILI